MDVAKAVGAVLLMIAFSAVVTYLLMRWYEHREYKRMLQSPGGTEDIP